MQRYTVGEAARLLGVGTDAIRKRIQRGTIATEFEGGTRYVLLDPSVPRHATGTDTGADSGRAGEFDALRSELVQEIRDRLRYVENQLEAERAAHAESRRLLAAALERIPPQIEAPSQEPSGGPSEATEQPGRVGPQAPLEEAQEDSQRAPWWRRMFSG